MKKVKQPEITERELNKIERHQKSISTDGYKPYITVRQSNSVGLCNIIFSHKLNRNVHLLSLGELSLFLHLEHQNNVIEIYEQYPLPINQTLSCAEELNIYHPSRYKERDHQTKVIPANTMTTDMVAITRDINSNTDKIQPYNYKPSKALSSKHESAQKVSRTRQKFQIERLYWEKQGLTLVQVTEQDLNPNKTYNLKWLRECFLSPLHLEVPQALYTSMVLTLIRSLKDKPTDTLKTQLTFVAETHNITLDQMFRLFQYACYNDDLAVDLDTKIELYRPLAMNETLCNAY
ncbi:TnsA endonuclease N-terminal domain-containing protein [Vibrio splendidus]